MCGNIEHTAWLKQKERKNIACNPITSVQSLPTHSLGTRDWAKSAQQSWHDEESWARQGWYILQQGCSQNQTSSSNNNIKSNKHKYTPTHKNRKSTTRIMMQINTPSQSVPILGVIPPTGIISVISKQLRTRRQRRNRMKQQQQQKQLGQGKDVDYGSSVQTETSA
mmetsp:Transcript_19985/g.56642  ORF Transcript_19985/g.56642 Transcript_19985/m.56642 type:complete len:166 (-) Transcript_19985:165-662(-)